MTQVEITKCYTEVMEDQGTRVHFELGGGERTDWFFVEHILRDEQDRGQEAISYMIDLCGMDDVNDPEDFVGMSVCLEEFDKIISRAKPGRNYSVALNKRVTKGSTKGARYVYVVSCECPCQSLCKIGIAISPDQRIRQLSTSSPYNLRLDYFRISRNAPEIEAQAHKHFASKRQNGEWFALPANDAIRHVNRLIDEAA